MEKTIGIGNGLTEYTILIRKFEEFERFEEFEEFESRA
jgi:hypothetical protein